jgi:hypothetical protein
VLGNRLAIANCPTLLSLAYLAIFLLDQDHANRTNRRQVTGEPVLWEPWLKVIGMLGRERLVIGGK